MGYSFMRNIFSKFILTTLLSVGFSAWASAVQPEQTDAESLGDSESVHAAVRLDGHPLFQITGTQGFPAEKRASEISDRLQAMAANPTRSTETLRIVVYPDYAAIMAKDTLLLRIFDPDSGMPGLTHAVYAELVKNAIAKGISDYRQARTPKSLLKSAGLAAAGVGLLLLLLIGWTRIYRKMIQMLEHHLKPRVFKIQTKSFDLLKASLLWDGVQGFMSVIHGTFIVLLVYSHVGFILRLFPWTRLLADNLLGLMLNPLKMLALSFISAVPGVMVVLVIGLLCYGTLHILSLFFTGVRTGSIVLAGFDPDWAIPTFRIVRVAIIALAVMIAYPHIPGSNSAAFKGISVFLGIVFSLGSTSFAANLIAGYSAIYRRAFRAGDCIEVDGFRGEVLEIQTLVTRLRTIKNEVIVIPNSAIVNSPVINYSQYAKDRGLIVHTTVGIGYETPWRQVEAMLLEAAARTPGFLTEPKPFVLQTSLGDFCVMYEINVYCSTPEKRLALTSALHQNILDLFNENGVQIMTPAYESDPAQPKVVPKDQWFTPLASTERNV